MVNPIEKKFLLALFESAKELFGEEDQCTKFLKKSISEEIDGLAIQNRLLQMDNNKRDKLFSKAHQKLVMDPSSFLKNWEPENGSIH